MTNVAETAGGAAFDVSGLRVLVTGAGRGIGLGIGTVFAEAGAIVALNALTPRFVAAAVAEVSASAGHPAVAVVGDVTTAEGAVDVVERAIDELGGIDVLVNNLGDGLRGALAVPAGSADAPMSDRAVAVALDLNLGSAIQCVRAAGDHFLARGSGCVINLSSVAAVRGGAGATIYAATKAGLVGFTRALALEWAPFGIRVNGIAPGAFPDPAQFSASARQALAERVPLGRVGDAREVGYLARYLASPAGAYVTGQTVFIDGGLGLG